MLIFLDMETTGVEVADKICSIALLNEKNYIYEHLNEGKKISPEASSIHHITNEMIKGKDSFADSKAHRFLSDNNNEESILISHNANFFLEKLAGSGLFWKGSVIDTSRVTKHLISECELFSLQVLRYELKLYRNEEKQKECYGIKDALHANNALGDVIVTELLLHYLEDIASIEKMIELSSKNVLIGKFSFGKHKGQFIEEVCHSDRAYAQWLLNKADDLDEDIKYSINYYLQG